MSQPETSGRGTHQRHKKPRTPQLEPQLFSVIEPAFPYSIETLRDGVPFPEE